MRARDIETEGTGYVRPTTDLQDENDQIAEEDHQLMSAPLSQLASVLAEGDILGQFFALPCAVPMPLTFKSPDRLPRRLADR